MKTLEISLDGYTDLPPGKIANVVTYLEMVAPPSPRPEPDRPDLVFRRIPKPEVGWYKATIRAIGQEWLWFSPLVMPEAALAAILRDPLREVYVLLRDGETVGIAELDRQGGDEAEISFFGVVASEIGTGAARFLMNRALEEAFRHGTRRVWLHTCTFDHPAAVPFYVKSGFKPFKLAIEVSDDPRLSGRLPATAGAHIALIHPKDGAGRP